MNSWSDIGIVLLSKNHTEKYKIVDIFTKSHGKVSAMVSDLKTNILSIFSNVEIDYFSKNTNSTGFWKIRDEKQSWIYSMNSKINMLICQSVCYLLNKTLPYNASHENLFEFVNNFLGNLHTFDKQDALSFYAYFEFILLEELGFGIDLNVCSICQKRENVKYISQATYAGVFDCCREKLSKNDSLFTIPECWHIWKNEREFSTRKSLYDIQNSLKITNYIINKTVLHEKNLFTPTLTIYF